MTAEERRAYHRAWYLKNREKVKARSKKWAEDNRERQKENHQRWVSENPARVEAIRRSWDERNPEYVRENLRTKQARRRARKKLAQGRSTATTRTMRWDFYGGKCAYCGSVADAMDHVIPLAKGGSDWPANLRPACHPCNRRKRDMSLSDFLSKEMIS